MVNTPLLKEYFLNGIYLRDINSDNPNGSKGKIVEEFSNIVFNLLKNEEVKGPFRPDNFRKYVVKVLP